MAIRHQLIHQPPSVLWSVLEQPEQYGKWVVGTHDSRLLAGQWPEVGSAIEYTLRLGPKDVRGRTTVRGWSGRGRSNSRWTAASWAPRASRSTSAPGVRRRCS